MKIGSIRFVLEFYGNDNVAHKHKILEELCREMKREFNISVMEVEKRDDPENAVIGVSAILPDHWESAKCDEFLKKISLSLNQKSPARVLSEDFEIFWHEA